MIAILCAIILCGALVVPCRALMTLCRALVMAVHCRHMPPLSLPTFRGPLLSLSSPILRKFGLWCLCISTCLRVTKSATHRAGVGLSCLSAMAIMVRGTRPWVFAEPLWHAAFVIAGVGGRCVLALTFVGSPRPVASPLPLYLPMWFSSCLFGSRRRSPSRWW